MIPLSSLRQALAAYEGWAYAPAVDGVRDCRYAHPIAPWCQPPGPQQTDCVAYVVGVVLGACHLAGVEVPWPIERHRQALVSTELQAHALAEARAGKSESGHRHLFGLPDALEAAGLAYPLEHQHTPPSWSVVQAWSSGWRSGHAMLLGQVGGRTVDLHEASRKAGRVITRPARWPLPWTHQRAVALRVDAGA